MSVGINVSYWIHGDKTEVSSKTFNGNSVEEARIGLPVGSVPTKPNAGDSNYCGLHDQGELPPLKEHGSLCKLLSCVKQAKEFNDVFLTTKLQTSNKSESIGSDSNPSKRPKI